MSNGCRHAGHRNVAVQAVKADLDQQRNSLGEGMTATRDPADFSAQRMQLQSARRDARAPGRRDSIPQCIQDVEPPGLAPDGRTAKPPFLLPAVYFRIHAIS